MGGLRTVWPLLLLPLSALAAEESPQDPHILRGLLDAARQEREAAAASLRQSARLDAGAVAGLWERLDARGRAVLLRALAGAGTEHAARVGWRRAAAAEPELFRAFVEGLAEGGKRAIFAEEPAELSPSRREALEALRVRWQIEEQLARLKSPTGQTGHYTGQFARLKAYVPRGLQLLFDIVKDREAPWPGEGSAGPYRSIHPGMLLFDPGELRELCAYSFAELVDPRDEAAMAQLQELWAAYWNLPERDGLERSELAPALAFSLHDLGVAMPARAYIRDLLHASESRSTRAARAVWALGFAYMRIGEYDLGQQQYERILGEIDAGSRNLAAYNLACSFAIRMAQEPARRDANRRLAIRYLRRAVELEFFDWQWMQSDGDLDAIRDDPAYKEIVDELRRRFPDRRRGAVSKKLEDFLKEREAEAQNAGGEK